MIPKTIHYCWFGYGRLPRMARKCIRSWRKYFPDYEIKEWNEENYDVRSIPYVAAAYDAGKFAYVSDYARFDILYRYGGIYFDTDVEVLRPLDDIIDTGPFMGCEINAVPDKGVSGRVAAGLGLGVGPGHEVYKKILDEYASNMSPKFDGGQTVVDIVTKILCKLGMPVQTGIVNVLGINIYPEEYFCPIAWGSTYKDARFTANTRTIHHYSGSWLSNKIRWQNWAHRHCGEKAAYYVGYFWRPPRVIVAGLWAALKRRLNLKP